MKTKILFAFLLASCLISKVANAQWTNVPGIRADKITCASASEVAVITSGATSNVFKLNGSSWVNQNGKLDEVAIQSNGTLWGIVPTSKDVYTKTTSGNWTLVNTTIGSQSGMQKISVRNNSIPVACRWQFGTTTYAYNGSAWSGYGGALTATNIAGAADGTTVAIGPDAFIGMDLTNIYKHNGSAWIAVGGKMGKVALRNGTQMVGLSGTSLFTFSNNIWTVRRTNVTDIAAASDGTIYITTDATADNVFRANWAELVVETPVITGAGGFCTGQTKTLTVTAPVTGLSYLWSNGASGTTTTVNTGGSYTVQAISTCCTSAVSNAQVVVENPIPTIPVVNGPSTVCLPAGTGLSVLSVQNPIAGYSYEWDAGANIIGSGTTLAINASGNYRVRVVGPCASAAPSAAIAVTRTPNAPQINSNPAAICPGTPINLPIWQPVANTTYLWSTGQTGNSITVSPTVTTNYTVQAIFNGCTTAVSTAATVTVRAPTPTPTITGITTFCTPAIGFTWAPLSVVSPASNTTYIWSTGQTGNSINVTTSGSYSVRAISNGCTSAVSNAIVMTVNISPAVPSGFSTAPINICPGSSTTISVPNPVTGLIYMWSNGQTGTSITVSTAGQYRVQASNAVGCTTQSSAPTTVVLLAIPFTPGISGQASFCSGGSTNLGVTALPANTTFLWSNGMVAANITVNTPGSYTARAISNGCTSAVSQAIVVTATPVVAVPTISGNASFCIGDQTTLSVVSPLPNTTYLWSNGTTANNITLYTTDVGNYTVRAISNSCTSAVSAITTVTIIARPADPTISGQLSFCAGSNTTLSVTSPEPNTTYLWSNGTTANSIIVSEVGNFRVRATNAAGCVSNNSPLRAVTVTALPNVPSISGSASFCAGSSNALSLSFVSPNTTYLWSNGVTGNTTSTNVGGDYTVRAISNGCTSVVSPVRTIIMNPIPSAPVVSGNTNICPSGGLNGTLISIVSPATNTVYLWNDGTIGNTRGFVGGTYTVRAISNGCTSAVSLPIVITEIPLPVRPVITAVGNNTCAVSLSATGGTSYVWSLGNVVQSATSATFSPSVSGAYTVTALNLAGCPSQVSLPVTVTVVSALAAPTVAAVGQTTFCIGGSVTLNASGAPAGASYTWSNGATGTSLTVSAAGTYTASYTSAGCNSAASLPRIITVNALPAAPSISITGNNTCAVSLSATGGTSYIWSLGSVVQSATSASFVPSVSGNYTVRALSAAGCSSAVSAPAVVVVTGALTAPTVVAAGPTTFCAGGNVTLNASGAPAGASYTWSNGTTGPSLIVSAAGTYTASYTSVGCNSAASSAVVVTVNALPTAAITQLGNVLSVGATANATYQWLLSGQVIANATAANHTALVSGIYSVRVTLNNCDAVSNTINLIVTSAASKLNASVKVYPNPTSGIVYVEIEQLADVQILVTDALGRHILSQKAQDKIALQLPKGLYFVRIQNREATSVHKVIVQ